MARVMAVTNQKGGVGKTTTCVNLAASLAATKRRVLLVDLDPQGNATMGSGVDKNSLELSGYDVLTKRASAAEVTFLAEASGFDILPANGDLTAAEVALMNEIGHFSSWYDLAVKRRGRTTVGASGLSVEQIAEFLGQLSATETCASPIADVALADAVRLCAEDLKAYYLEATSAQPGDASAVQLNDWFWHDTAASPVLRTLNKKFLGSDDQSMQILARESIQIGVR